METKIYRINNSNNNNNSNIDYVCSPCETTNDLVIVLGVVAGVLALSLLVIGGIFLYVRFKHHRKKDSPEFSASQAPQRKDYSVYDVPSQIIKSQDSIARLTHEATENVDIDWNIPYSEIQLKYEIGKGAFGIVWKASWRFSHVAVKQLNTQNFSIEDKKNFLREILLMKRLRPSPNVVLLIGIVSEPLCVVTEYYSNGSLQKLIRSEKEIPSPVIDKIILGIARGMHHLHLEKIIHRDLAARNVLLTSDFTAKICDFGMSRFNEKDIGETNNHIGPLKWMPPECILNWTYSTASDVWSFGITLIEIFTRSVPFPNLEPMEAAIRISSGSLLPEIPLTAPPKIAKILQACFQTDPKKRPKFDWICSQLLSAKIPNLDSNPLNGT